MAFLGNPNTVTVPAPDSADNNYLQDVIGNKDDGHTSTSLSGIAHVLNDHFHTPSNVYPTLANGVVLTAGAAWTLGTRVEIVPQSTITEDFDIHFISIEAMSANEVYEVVLYYGQSEVECGRVRVTKNANLDATVNVPILTGTVDHKVLVANAKIKAAIATASGGDTMTISLFYHTY